MAINPNHQTQGTGPYWLPNQENRVREANRTVTTISMGMAAGLVFFSPYLLPQPLSLLAAAGVLMGGEGITSMLGEERRGLTHVAGGLVIFAAATIASEDLTGALTVLAPVGVHLLTWLPGPDTYNRRIAQIVTLAILVLIDNAYSEEGMSDRSPNTQRALHTTMAIAAATFMCLGVVRLAKE